MRKIAAMAFRRELASRGISIRSLGNPDSPNYIGISDKTIMRGIRDEQMSTKTLTALSSVVDISHFVVEEPSEELIRLREENAKLRQQMMNIREIAGKVLGL